MRLKLKVNSGWWNFVAPMRENVDFQTHGALWGEAKPIGVGVPFGRLPVEFRTMALYDAVYVVYSYGTPVAWKTFGEWHVPDVRYSVTTSKHMSRIRPAVAVLQAELDASREAVADPAPVRSPYCTRCGNSRMGCVDARCPGERAA